MGSVAPIFDIEVAGQLEPVLAHARLPGIKPRPCVIMHYNRDGACLYSDIQLPDCFILRALDSSVERICQVVWRMDGTVGVEFVNARTMGRMRAPRVEASDKVAILYPK